MSERMQVQGEWDLHKMKAERGYQALYKDTSTIHSDSNYDLLTFDLKHALATPILTTNIVKGNYGHTYNLGIHNGCS